MRQPKWDKFEAALLIETYWNIRNGKISRKEAAASLSKLLRDRMPENEIDETYRNENWINKDDIPGDEFVKYCLEPAKEMRAVIKKQLCIIDPKEFDVPGKNTIPDVQYRW